MELGTVTREGKASELIADSQLIESFLGAIADVAM